MENRPSKGIKCDFCGRGNEASSICGKLYSTDECSAHKRCMQYSARLAQYYGDAFKDFGGFKVHKVLDELRRGKRLNCSVCKNSKATCGCAYSRCSGNFHYPCAREQKISKRLSVTDLSTNKVQIWYRVFCSEKHFEQFKILNENFLLDEGPSGSDSDASIDIPSDSDVSSESSSEIENSKKRKRETLQKKAVQSNKKSKKSKRISNLSNGSISVSKSSPLATQQTVKALDNGSSTSDSDMPLAKIAHTVRVVKIDDLSGDSGAENIGLSQFDQEDSSFQNLVKKSNQSENNNEKNIPNGLHASQTSSASPIPVKTLKDCSIVLKRFEEIEDEKADNSVESAKSTSKKVEVQSSCESSGSILNNAQPLQSFITSTSLSSKGSRSSPRLMQTNRGMGDLLSLTPNDDSPLIIGELRPVVRHAVSVSAIVHHESYPSKSNKVGKDAGKAPIKLVKRKSSTEELSKVAHSNQRKKANLNSHNSISEKKIADSRRSSTANELFADGLFTEIVSRSVSDGQQLSEASETDNHEPETDTDSNETRLRRTNGAMDVEPDDCLLCFVCPFDPTVSESLVGDVQRVWNVSSHRIYLWRPENSAVLSLPSMIYYLQHLTHVLTKANSFTANSETLEKLIFEWYDYDNGDCERWIQEVEAAGTKSAHAMYREGRAMIQKRISHLNNELGEHVITLVEDTRCYALYLRLCTITDPYLRLRLHLPRFYCKLKLHSISKMKTTVSSVNISKTEREMYSKLELISLKMWFKAHKNELNTNNFLVFPADESLQGQSDSSMAIKLYDSISKELSSVWPNSAKRIIFIGPTVSDALLPYENYFQHVVPFLINRYLSAAAGIVFVADVCSEQAVKQVVSKLPSHVDMHCWSCYEPYLPRSCILLDCSFKKE